MGYALLILMGVGMLISWRRSSLDNLRRNFLSPLIIATLGTLVLFWILFEKTMQWGVYIIFWSTIFVTSTILFEFVKATQIKIKQTGSNILMGLFYVISKNRRRYGGLIIHFGVVLMFLGFAGSFFSIEKDLTLEAGESNEIGNYRIEFQSVNEFMSDNARHRAAVINVYDSENNFLETLKPAKSFYPTQPQPLTEVAIRRTFLEDLYLIFSSENAEETNSVTIKVHINPLVGIAWAALPIFTIGIGICLTYRPKSLIAQELVNRERYMSTLES